MSMTDAIPYIDFSKLTPISHMFGDDFEETQQLAALFEEAELYLSSFDWCEGVKQAYFGLGVSDFIGIFLFEFMPPARGTGNFLWVVAGDIPPAHLGIDHCPDPTLALDAYIGEMKNWCNAVLAGGAAACTFNVNLAATLENARDVLRRITLLDTVVLAHYKQESGTAS